MDGKSVKSELSSNVLELIKNARYSQEHYKKALADISALGIGMPTHTQAEHVAKMFAAYDQHEEVKKEIGDKINNMRGWVIIEMYIQLGQF